MSNTFNQTQQEVLQEIAGINDFPKGAYNIRVDGKSAGRQSTANITITPKTDKPGIDVIVKPGTKKEMIHIPVVLSQDSLVETVYNDFYIGEDADVTIVAGCGIHNCGSGRSQHDGIHSFYLKPNSRVRYLEKHTGTGELDSERVLNPVTNCYLEEGSQMEMDTVQIKGVTSTRRVTQAELAADSTLIVSEKLMTHGDQSAQTEFEVNLAGENCSTNIISRSVARDNSRQLFLSKIDGNNKCAGHSECDAIIMDNASVKAVPEITANHIDAALIHEAAIGKIAGEQLIKLMTLGLTELEAEEQIINGFLK